MLDLEERFGGGAAAGVKSGMLELSCDGITSCGCLGRVAGLVGIGFSLAAETAVADGFMRSCEWPPALVEKTLEFTIDPRAREMDAAFAMGFGRGLGWENSSINGVVSLSVSFSFCAGGVRLHKR